MQKQNVTGSQQPQQSKTGAPNVEYDLFSEVHCLLKGNAALEQYIQDARDAGEDAHAGTVGRPASAMASSRSSYC